MIDAYTIGITLALDNGVAAGIVSIRQDLAALDRAVAASATGLLAMRRLSEALNSSTFAHPMIVPPTRPQPVPTIAESDPLASSIPPLTPPSAVSPLSYSPPNQAMPQAAPSESNNLPPPVTEPHRTAINPSTAAAPIGQAAPVTPHTEPKPLPAFRQLGEGVAIRPFTLSVTNPTPAMSPKPAATSPLAAMLSALPSPMPEPAAPSPPRPISPRQNPAPARMASLAPKATTSPPTSHTRPDASNGAITSQAPPQAQSNPKTGSPHGEIILDGARLGRWMSDRLARAASRPGSGTTAFDPRISALYPGAPNGS